eukprot:10925365-Prorocentrum_lima.AAC.1
MAVLFRRSVPAYEENVASKGIGRPFRKAIRVIVVPEGSVLMHDLAGRQSHPICDEVPLAPIV